MKRGILCLFLILSAQVSLANPNWCKTRQNITAEVMFGTWEQHDALINKFLHINGIIDHVKFTRDDSVKSLFDPLQEHIEGCVYTAGWYSISGILTDEEGNTRDLNFRSPFILSSLNGNPTIYYDEHGWTEGKTAIEDLHIGYLMSAKARNRYDDILFIGGDNNNQALLALARKL